MGDRALHGTKGFCGREAYFEAHLPPDNPIVPGVYLLEGLSACARWLTEIGSGFTRTLALRGLGNAKFVRPVRPGDVVELRVTRESESAERHVFLGECWLDGSRIVSAELAAALIPVTDPDYVRQRVETLRFLLREGAGVLPRPGS